MAGLCLARSESPEDTFLSCLGSPTYVYLLPVSVLIRIQTPYLSDLLKVFIVKVQSYGNRKQSKTIKMNCVQQLSRFTEQPEISRYLHELNHLAFKP